MTDKGNHTISLEISTSTSNKVGFYSALLTTMITLITLGLGMIAIPISGANCPADCMEYPYLDTVSQYPRDYLWMYAAIFMLLAYLALMASIHHYADRQKAVFSQIGLSLATIAAPVTMPPATRSGDIVSETVTGRASLVTWTTSQFLTDSPRVTRSIRLRSSSRVSSGARNVANDPWTSGSE